MAGYPQFLTLISIVGVVIVGLTDSPLAESVVSSAAQPKGVIKFGVIIPYHGPHPWIREVINPAVMIGLEEVDRNGSLLNNYDLEVMFGDSRCDDTRASLVAIEMMWAQAADVFLGPVCNDFGTGHISLYSTHWGIPVISPGALVHDLADKTKYPTLTRISGSYDNRALAMQLILEHFNWVRLSFIYSKTHIGDPYFYAARSIYQATKMKFLIKYPDEKPVFFGLLPGNIEPDYELILRKVTERSRGKLFSTCTFSTYNSILTQTQYAVVHISLGQECGIPADDDLEQFILNENTWNLN